MTRYYSLSSMLLFVFNRSVFMSFHYVLLQMSCYHVKFIKFLHCFEILKFLFCCLEQPLLFHSDILTVKFVSI
jgi:hypothetical protein